MSGIFNLFGGTGNAAKQHFSLGPTEILKKSGLDTTTANDGMAVKNVGLSRPKPKGLSIRSGNDLNISKLSIKTSLSPARKSPVKAVLKPQLRSNEAISQPRSPRNDVKILKMQVMKSKQLKAMKARSPEGNFMSEKKQIEENIFKKPATPKKPTKKCRVYPEPEKLAFDYDYEQDMKNFSLDTEFLKLLKLSRDNIKPFEDEGFESDPETIPLSSPSTLHVVISAFDDSPVKPSTPELPSLSDDEDWFNEI